MWKYKDLGLIGVIFFIVVFIFSLLVNSSDITVSNLYFNVQMFILVFLIYYIEIKKCLSSQLFFNLHKFSKLQDYYKYMMVRFLPCNILICSFVYLTFLICAKLFGEELIAISSSYLFPIQQFIIFEIIFFIILAKFMSKSFNRWYNIIFIVAIMMYIFPVLSGNSIMTSLNLFKCFFSPNDFNCLLVHYSIWVLLLAVLFNFSSKEVEK